jgi:hypothetical protein
MLLRAQGYFGPGIRVLDSLLLLPLAGNGTLGIVFWSMVGFIRPPEGTEGFFWIERVPDLRAMAHFPFLANGLPVGFLPGLGPPAGEAGGNGIFPLAGFFFLSKGGTSLAMGISW